MYGIGATTTFKPQLTGLAPLMACIQGYKGQGFSTVDAQALCNQEMKATSAQMNAAGGIPTWVYMGVGALLLGGAAYYFLVARKA